MPSYTESSGRLAQEAILNDIPVIASDRGGLPETLADAGLTLPLASEYLEDNPFVPPPRRVVPWVEAVARLWDDPEVYTREAERARAAKGRWRPETLAEAYTQY